MPKTVVRPPHALALLLLSVSLVSCNANRSDIVSAGAESMVSSVSANKIESQGSSLSSKADSPGILSDASFRPEAPSLAGLTFGTSDDKVLDLYGLSDDSYLLPGDTDNESVRIWQYSGFAVGLNTGNKVVYVEINSAEARSGIEGLVVGMDGAQAAQLLGADISGTSNVISVQAAGGSLKVDLDPDSRTVLSIKLISNDA